MKSAIIAAIVAAVVGAGASSAATTLINGRTIRPHSIPLNRLEQVPGIKIKRVQSANVTVPGGSATGLAEADCPNGWNVIGGGGWSTEGILYGSDESNNNHGWQVEIDNSGYTSAATVYAIAVCER